MVRKATQASPTPPTHNLEEMAAFLQNNQQEMSTFEYQVMMVNHMIDIGKMMKGIEGVKEQVANHAKRLEALENKCGDDSEFPIPLTIVMQNIPPNEQFDDTHIARKVIQNLKIEGVGDAEVKRVLRKGHKPANGNQKSRAGTLLVELSSKEVKQKVLRAKKSLAQDECEKLKVIRIDSMKTPEVLNQEHFNRTLLRMTPGGDQYYIAGSGALRPQTRSAEAGRFARPPPPRSYAGAARPHHQGPPGSQEWHPSQQHSQHLAPPARPPLSQQPTVPQPPLLRPPVLVHLADQRQSGFHTPDFLTR